MKTRDFTIGLVLAALATACSGGGDSPSGNSFSGSPGPAPAPGSLLGPAVQLSKDPITDSNAQHPTAVEPSILSNGSTIVSAFQLGRIASGASDAIGFATSRDGGATWSRGIVPGLTVDSGGTNANVTDAVVAYDAATQTWMIESLAFPSSGAILYVSRSTDGVNWDAPVEVATGNYDKCWVACDNGATSPHRGTCYAEWDDMGTQKIYLSRSTDGGQTWSSPQGTPDSATGIGGQFAIQPSGNVVLPFYNLSSSNPGILVTSSSDGGQTWSNSAVIAQPQTASMPLRGETDPQVATETSGKIDVAWFDCRFESGCSGNDIVMTSSSDGSNWSSPARIGADPVGSGVNHFAPTLAASPSSDGHLALMYYAGSSSSLAPYFTTSGDRGITWSPPAQLWKGFGTGLLATSNEGPMLGDYFAITFAGGAAYPAFTAPADPTQSALNQQIFTVPMPAP